MSFMVNGRLICIIMADLRMEELEEGFLRDIGYGLPFGPEESGAFVLFLEEIVHLDVEC